MVMKEQKHLGIIQRPAELVNWKKKKQILKLRVFFSGESAGKTSRYRIYYDNVNKELEDNPRKPFIPYEVQNPNFTKLRDTVYNSFNEAGVFVTDRNYGLDDSLFSDTIQKLRNDTYSKYKG